MPNFGNNADNLYMKATEQTVLLGEPAAHDRYRPDVDGLRTVAVTSVIVYHMAPKACVGGFFGVDIFFVISGYVVAGSLLSSSRSTTTEYIIGFYARRVKRLMPALCLMVAAISLLTAVLLPPPLKDYFSRV